MTKQVAETTNSGNDAVMLGAKYHASPELVAELVVRFLETGFSFDGWHYLLEHDSCSAYVAAVIDLVEQETSSLGGADQFMSPTQVEP